MRKSTLVIAAAIIAVLCVPAVAFASLAPRALEMLPIHHVQRETHVATNQDPSDAVACPGFYDADGDGICDNCDARNHTCPGYVDADGDGVCDNHRGASGGCPGYADQGDGARCDNNGSGCDRGHGCGGSSYDGSNVGQGHHGRQHHGGHDA